MQFQNCKSGNAISSFGVSGEDTNADIGSLSNNAPYSGRKVSK